MSAHLDSVEQAGAVNARRATRGRLGDGVSRRADLLMRGMILGVGLLCFVLLAWDHLGLGALISPPQPTAPHQAAMAGPYRVSLYADSGQLKAAGPNTLSLVVQDTTRHDTTVGDATVRIQPIMTSMPMEDPLIGMSATTGGRYVAHPRFSMAGDWRLQVSVARPGQPASQASFVVSVRWS